MKSLMPLFCCLANFTLSSAALAADRDAGRDTNWPLRPGNVPFDHSELAELPGQSFVFYDDGEAHFALGGAYAYTYSVANGGGTAWGSYHIAADGSVCVDYANGLARCDLYVHSGARIVLITSDGERYPVR